jgi:plasmid stabilization system protein ParE
VVKWSARAVADLKAIHDNIARDAPINAHSVAHDIVQLASDIEATPLIGRQIPELNIAQLREFPVHWAATIHLTG